MWKMFFDGASSYEGVGDGVLFMAPVEDMLFLSLIDYNGVLIMPIMSVSMKL